MISNPTLGDFWEKAKEAYIVLETAYHNKRDPFAENSLTYYIDKDDPEKQDIRLQIRRILSYISREDPTSAKKMEESAELCDELFGERKKEAMDISYVLPTSVVEHELVGLPRNSKDLVEEIFGDFDIGNRVIQFVGFTNDPETGMEEATVEWQGHLLMAMQYRDGNPNLLLRKTMEIIPNERVEYDMNYRVGLKQMIDIPAGPGNDKVYESILNKPEAKSINRMNYYRLRGFTLNDEDFFTMDVRHVKPYGEHSQGRIFANIRYYSCLTDRCVENVCYTTELPMKRVFEKFGEIEEKLLEIYPGKIAKGMPRSDKSSILIHTPMPLRVASR